MGSWTNGANGYAEDASYASTKAGEGTEHQWLSYGITAQGGRIIKVEVGVKGYCDGNEWARMEYSHDGGTNWTFFYDMTWASNTLIYTDVTAHRTWTYTMLSNLRIRALYKEGGGAKSYVYIDWAPVRIEESVLKTITADSLTASESIDVAKAWFKAITDVQSLAESISIPVIAKVVTDLFNFSMENVKRRENIAGTSGYWYPDPNEPTECSTTNAEGHWNCDWQDHMFEICNSLISWKHFYYLFYLYSDNYMVNKVTKGADASWSGYYAYQNHGPQTDDMQDFIFDERDDAFYYVGGHYSINKTLEVGSAYPSDTTYGLTYRGSVYYADSGLSREYRGCSIARDWNGWFYLSFCREDTADSGLFYPYFSRSNQNNWTDNFFNPPGERVKLADESCYASKVLFLENKADGYPADVIVFWVPNATDPSTGLYQLKCKKQIGGVWDTEATLITSFLKDRNRWDAKADFQRHVFLVTLEGSGEYNETVQYRRWYDSGWVGPIMVPFSYYKSGSLITATQISSVHISVPRHADDYKRVYIFYVGLEHGSSWWEAAAFMVYTLSDIILPVYIPSGYRWGNMPTSYGPPRVTGMMTPAHSTGYDRFEFFNFGMCGPPSSPYNPTWAVGEDHTIRKGGNIRDNGFLSSEVVTVTQPYIYTILDAVYTLDLASRCYWQYISDVLAMLDVAMRDKPVDISDEAFIGALLEAGLKIENYYAEDYITFVEVWYQYRLYPIRDRVRIIQEKIGTPAREYRLNDTSQAGDQYSNDRTKVIYVDDVLTSDEVQKL